METAPIILIVESPNLVGIVRKAQELYHLIDHRHKSLDLCIEVKHFKDGIDLGLNKEFNLKVDNNMTMFVRDENFEYIPNPDYDSESEILQEEFLKMPAFDYISNLIYNSNLSLMTVLGGYIKEEAVDGRFD